MPYLSPQVGDGRGGERPLIPALCKLSHVIPAFAGMTINRQTYPRPRRLRLCFSRSGRTGGVSSVICGGRERGAHPHDGVTALVPVGP